MSFPSFDPPLSCDSALSLPTDTVYCLSPMGQDFHSTPSVVPVLQSHPSLILALVSLRFRHGHANSTFRFPSNGAPDFIFRVWWSFNYWIACLFPFFTLFVRYQGSKPYWEGTHVVVWRPPIRIPQAATKYQAQTGSQVLGLSLSLSITKAEKSRMHLLWEDG